MTEIIITPVIDGNNVGKKEFDMQRALMIEGAANADGSWKQGWQPKLLQCFIRKAPHAVYTVVHNADKSSYALSLSLIKPDPGLRIEILEKSKIDFTFRIVNEKDEFVDWPFRFAMSVLING